MCGLHAPKPFQLHYLEKDNFRLPLSVRRMLALLTPRKKLEFGAMNTFHSDMLLMRKRENALHPV